MKSFTLLCKVLVINYTANLISLNQHLLEDEVGEEGVIEERVRLKIKDINLHRNVLTTCKKSLTSGYRRVL